jgi:hypothetical protein
MEYKSRESIHVLKCVSWLTPRVAGGARITSHKTKIIAKDGTGFEHN